MLDSVVRLDGRLRDVMTELDFARRRLLSMGGLALGSLGGALGIAGCTSDRPSMPAPPDLNRGAAAMAVVAQPPHARDQWATLAAGNARFAGGGASHERQDDPDHRRSQQDGAKPYACILTCMDSRVPPELIFDAGLGDLASVRTAAGCVDDVTVGSVEFAVHHLGVRLLVVLGHSDCKAVRTAMAEVKAEQANGPGRNAGRDDEPDNQMGVVTTQIGYSVRKTPTVEDQEVYAAKCVAMQAVDTVQRLRERSELLTRATQAGGDDHLSIVPTVYDIGTGLVQRVTESRVLRD